MPTVTLERETEFDSGEVVDPGTYVDVETGAVVQVQERDSLPEGIRLIHYKRHFRRVEPANETSEPFAIPGRS